MERESEEAPPWLDAAFAPSIPESVDEEYRLTAQARKATTESRMLMHSPVEQISQTFVTVADLHHAGENGAALRKNCERSKSDVCSQARTSFRPLAGSEEACVVNELCEHDLMDADLNRVLDSVLNRCYLLCHGFEWQAWQVRVSVTGTDAHVGDCGSRVYSPSQARHISQSWHIGMCVCVCVCVSLCLCLCVYA